MDSPNKDWRRVAKYVVAQRRALGLTQDEVKSAGGPSAATLRNIEGALQDSYKPHVLSNLERVLRWQHGSIDRIHDGGEPIPVGAAPDEPEDPAIADLAARLERLEATAERQRQENAELRRMLEEITGEDDSNEGEQHRKAQ